MKNLTIRTLATGIVASTLLFAASCKKGDTGPAGAAGTNGVVPTSTDGFIKGTISGTYRNGTVFNNLSFDYVNYWGTPSGTLDSTGSVINPYTFSITRGMDIFGNNSASLSVSTASTTASAGTIRLTNFSYTQSTGTNKEFEFMTNTTITGNITGGLVYNTSTGLFTGSYTFNVSGADNNTGNPATITLSFQATMTQLYYMRTHKPNVNNVSLKD